MISNVLSQGFEGPEKKLEIQYSRVPGNDAGLCARGREDWQRMLDLVKCTIISHTSNGLFDAYVLSESSLFVYPYKIILKTCGTTTLLRCVPTLVALARWLDTAIEFCFFSRKNFVFPDKQEFPHSSFEDEVAWLNTVFDGHGYVFGPRSMDQWFFYYADLTGLAPGSHNSEAVFEVLMHDLDPAVMAQFHTGVVKEGTVAAATGIASILPGSTIDEFLFNPCGYSMNGLLDESYWTIHVTPEPHCSFVSFETNAPTDNYLALLDRVISVFRPGRFTVTMFSDSSALPYDGSPSRIGVNVPVKGFARRSLSHTEFDGYCVSYGHYQSQGRCSLPEASYKKKPLELLDTIHNLFPAVSVVL